MCVRQPLDVQPKRSSPEEAVGPNEPPSKKSRPKGKNSGTKRLINVSKTVTELFTTTSETLGQENYAIAHVGKGSRRRSDVEKEIDALKNNVLALIKQKEDYELFMSAKAPLPADWETALVRFLAW